MLSTENQYLKSGSIPQLNHSNDFPSRQTIDDNIKNIKLTDRNDDYDLDLFCYVSCDANQSDVIKKSRGLVFNQDKLIAGGFPYTYEYSFADNEDDIFNNILNHHDFSSTSKYRFFDAYEGSTIRLFYFKYKISEASLRK